MDWRKALLRKIGARPTQQNLAFLATWQRWEGGHTNNSARYNWLNTTHGHGTSINSDGVKSFGSFKEGITAMAETLRNGRYGDLLDAFHSGDPYESAPAAGLQTWVSGRPDGNPAYAKKILGGYSGGSASKAADSSVPHAPKKNRAFDPDLKIAKTLFGFDSEFMDIATGLRDLHSQDDVITRNQSPVTPAASAPRGGGIAVPGQFGGTHVTDGLGWGTKTAKDYMGDPGTAVRLPYDVEVVYYHPEGAQGGGSMLVRTEDGREYWIGHISSPHGPGDRIRRGGVVAVVANQNVSAPHAHVDTRGGRR